MTGLEKLVRRLVKAEVPGELWVDGSFTTEDIDPDDVDLLLHLPGDYWIEVLGETTQEKMRVIDWYCEEARRDTHKCDTHLWAEYPPDHPLYERNEEEREYWVGVYGESLSGVTKGIAVVELPGKLS